MGRNKKFKKILPKVTNRINAPLIPEYDSSKPGFSFREMRYGGKGCLSNCDRDAKSSVADTLLRLSQLTWKQIHSKPKDSLGYEPIPRDRFKVPLPASITPEVKLLVFRFSEVGRMAGFRKQDIFNIVAIGSHHDLY